MRHRQSRPEENVIATRVLAKQIGPQTLQEDDRVNFGKTAIKEC